MEFIQHRLQQMDGRPRLFSARKDLFQIKPIRQYNSTHGPIFACKFSNKNKQVFAIVDEEGFLSIKNPYNDYQISHFLAHQNAVFDLCWSNDDSKIVTGGGDQIPRVWDVETGQLTARFYGHLSSVKSISNDPFQDGIFCTTARDGHILVWDLRCSGKVFQIPAMQGINEEYKSKSLKPADVIRDPHETEAQKKSKKDSSSSGFVSRNKALGVSCAKYLIDCPNKLISSGTGDGLLKIWDMRFHKYHSNKPIPTPFDSSTILEEWKRPHAFTALTLDPKGNIVYASSTDNSIYQFNLTNLQTPTLKLTSKSYLSYSFYIKIAISPCSRFLLSGSLDRNVHCWNVGDGGGEPIIYGSHDEVVGVVEWGESYKTFASCSDDGHIKVWKFDDSKRNSSFQKTSAQTLNAENGSDRVQFVTESESLVPCILPPRKAGVPKKKGLKEIIKEKGEKENEKGVEVDDSLSLRDLFTLLDTDQITLNTTRLNPALTQIKTILKNGDILTINQSNLPQKIKPIIQSSKLDQILEKQSGQVKRKLNPHFCSHSDNSMCDYCQPLDPWDQTYLQGGQHFPQLDSLNFKLVDNCKGNHLPYPKGICSKCQPSAVVLNPQLFRMVDHVEFESPNILDSFISFWRKSGGQRFGIMYGRYEAYENVPLGVKAIVSAIYEPPQENQFDCIQVQIPNPNQQKIDSIATSLNLERVGMIYTDLMDDGTGQGKVICKRHIKSYFLSSAECVNSARMQLENPYITRMSTDGKFSSRFVTCVISGDHNDDIHVSTFQVSHVAEAMVRDDVIEASIDPAVLRVKESTPKQYIPEVFYKYNNEYGVNVQEAAKPTFPGDYLIVTQTSGTPVNPQNTTFSINPHHFPIENRTLIHSETQDYKALKSYLVKCGLWKGLESGKRVDGKGLKACLNDLHLLLFLANCLVLGFVKCTEDDEQRLAEGVVGCSGWQTLMVVLNEEQVKTSSSSLGANFGQRGVGGGQVKPKGGVWPCRHCTFVNEDTEICEMCGLPSD